MNYEKGDQVFLFGFSRGAFTVRSLAGMICRCGLLDREAFLDLPPGERQRALARILRAYRSAKVMPAPSEGETPEERAHDVRRALAIDDLPFRDARIPVHFIGVWDTVDAVGLPFDDVKVVDWIWRRLFKRRLWGFHDRTLSAQVHHAYQALALDDERRTFHPNVWDHENAPADLGAGAEPARPNGLTSGAPEWVDVRRARDAGNRAGLVCGRPLERRRWVREGLTVARLARLDDGQGRTPWTSFCAGTASGVSGRV